MTAGAAPTTAVPAAPRRRRFARWRPGVALGAVVAAVLVSQALALGVILAAGGEDDAPDWLRAIGSVVADLVLLGVVLLVARRGADKLGAATLGIRRTAFWPAVG